MKLEVLLSCMHQKEFSIIEKSNLQEVDTLIINQCDKDEFIQIDKNHRIINTKTRGLSVSRNIGLNNTKGDICVLSDDDEIFLNDMVKNVQNAYKRLSDADIIIFNVTNWPNKLGSKERRLSKYDLMKVSSIQITFRKGSIKNNVEFDTLLGSGTSNGPGEENKFLLDCLMAKMNIYYVPQCITTVDSNKSTWFMGFDNEYFYKRGSMTRYIYGYWFSIIYAFYFVLTKRKIYLKYTTSRNAMQYILKGIRDNNIKKNNSLNACSKGVKD